jgi:hypothetical protein
MIRSAALDYLYFIVRRDDGEVGHADEEAALDDAGQEFQLALHPLWIVYLAAAAVEYVVAVIRRVDFAALVATQQRLCASHFGDTSRGDLPRERDDLDGQGEAAEEFDALAGVGDDYESPCGARDQLLAQQRAAAALYEREIWAYLVRAVNREV